MEEILNSAEVMEFLGIKSPTTLIKYESQGLIKNYRPFGGRKKYYKKSEIMNLIK